ncbi:tubulin polyglutamylase complex subunit 1 isoform X2 [Parambassis ranga]|uniref:Tubulin polyglutamylase complex subunit 1 isoform X2 n=1 Tax=Parambassis ranga TaxID=210632 RepID=A0A6P7HMZ0_9TELE|nr:tubulin polyglutamylase complex subunit 1 isoform X2 [Parambassis ranga]
MPAGKATKSDGDREFLSQAGVGELLRGAILKMVEARSDDPIGFLADHFCNLASVTDTGAQEQQLLNRALWHLRLAHHSQRSAFSNNVRVAYDLLNLTTPRGGGVSGSLYTHTLQCLCSEGGVPASTSAPLLRCLHCHNHEAVPYDVFRYGVLTCAVFSDYIRQAQRLYAEVCSPDAGPASRALGLAVLGTLKEALETSQGCDAIRYLEASAKISPYKLAHVMVGGQTQGPGGNMDAKEFENEAAELFIARVKVVS